MCFARARWVSFRLYCAFIDAMLSLMIKPLNVPSLVDSALIPGLVLLVPGDVTGEAILSASRTFSAESRKKLRGLRIFFGSPYRFRSRLLAGRSR